MLNRRTPIFLLCASLSASALLGSQSALSEDAQKETLKTDVEKTSYAIGLKYGQGMKRDLGELELEKILAGFKAGFSGEKALLTDAEATQILTAFQQSKRAEMEKQHNEKAQANLDKGKAFLAKNGKKSGITTTESGLQYEVLKAGDGDAPGPNDKVEVHYEGTLIDGTVFDSSRQRGKTIEFGVGGVIKGWTEALQLMKPGAHWKLYIPASLAYGERGTGSIGPNETLIFDVELINVTKRETAGG
jgi:FKBP-type peptidyl-prolyl cis-trans isomerase FklB